MKRRCFWDFKWYSSRILENKNNGSTKYGKSRLCELNVLFSSAILLSGNMFVKIKRLADAFNMNIMHQTTYNAHCRKYTYPAVREFYYAAQVSISVLFYKPISKHQPEKHNFQGGIMLCTCSNC